MSKLKIEELKNIIAEAKARSPKRPLYPDTVKEGIGQLVQHLPRNRI